MSGPYDHGMNMPIPNMMDSSYPGYDGNFNTAYPRLSGPPTHFDGVAFWYNPPNTEQMYESDTSMFNSQGGALPPAGVEAVSVKHRRTRSGCFTCRSRRVKCDETRPVCDRCKKGNRECEFPQPTSSSKRARQGEHRSPKDHQIKQEGKDENMSGLSTIKDESEDDDRFPMSPTERPRLESHRTDSAQSVTQSTKSKNLSETSSAGRDQVSPRSTDVSDTHSPDGTPASSMRTVANSAEMQDRQAKIRALKPDIQKYLQFQQEHMTFYHYFYKLDPTDFIHTEFIDLALTYEPLLYAVVGFAAYLYELRQPNPKLSHFLGYHSKSMAMLRKGLEKNASVTDATLLTVLQLATFEEYIGDWVNLAGHHRAAFAIICDMYTPELMMETNVGRRIFSWAARLDVIVSLMAGIQTKLDRPWFEANAAWYARQISNDPDGDPDVENILAYYVSANRLVGMDMASIFAKFSKKELSLEDFHAENAKIVQKMEGMKRQIELINDEYYRVQEFPLEKVQPLTPDDIVNPYVPGGLFKDALWPLNFMWIDWYSIEQMQRHQTAKLLQQPMPPELELLSLEQCRIYEAIERWPDAPSGAILSLHASLGLATVFLRKDKRHTMWARRKLAAIERLGYVFPPAFRKQMGDMWGEPSVQSSWLPNDESDIPMLREIRKVVVERHENDKTSVESLADVRDISAIFAKLDMRTQKTAPAGGSLSPMSDGSGGNSDPGCNPGFSPTKVGFSDSHSATTLTPDQER